MLVQSQTVYKAWQRAAGWDTGSTVHLCPTAKNVDECAKLGTKKKKKAQCAYARLAIFEDKTRIEKETTSLSPSFVVSCQYL